MLDRQIRGYLRMGSALSIKQIADMTVLDAREQTEIGARTNILERPTVDSTFDMTIPGTFNNDIKIRVYRPNKDLWLPGIVFFHGGGHVVGSLESEDVTARFLCSGVGAIVISVDYRLAPENKFPAAVIDAYDAVRWIIEHAVNFGIDLKRLGLAGDSAGANLATVVSIMARNRNTTARYSSLPTLDEWPEIKLQGLVYPIVDFGMQDQSYEKYASGFGLISKDAMHWFRNHYLNGPEDIEDWMASPIKAKDLSGIAPVFMISAENDVLKDEGLRYVQRLTEAGVPVERIEYPGAIHTFFVMVPNVDIATKAQLHLAQAFKTAFA